eukprot:56885-Pyramimonas_sp.AAC.1
MIIPGTDMHGLFFGRGATVLHLMKTPSLHLAIKVDEYGDATEANGSTASTVTANPQCEEMPMLVKEVADAEPNAGQPASSNAGAPAASDARAFMMSQDSRGIRFSTNEESLSYAIQSLVNNAPKTWNRQAMVYQAFYEEGSEWAPPDNAAGAPA